jgi:hypothetical protein
VWPEIYVYPLSPSTAESLAAYYRADHSAWSQTQLVITGPQEAGRDTGLVGQVSEALMSAVQPLPAQAADRARREAAPSASGRLIVELLPAAPGELQVTVTRTCNTPDATASEEALLAEIFRVWPQAVTLSAEAPARRGGPAATPEDRRLQIVRGWLGVQGRMNQEVYAGSRGIAVSTLRRWMRQLQEDRKL